MPDTNPQETLDTNASEYRLNRFESAWRAGGTSPDWRQHLPADEEQRGPDYISDLLLMDIEYRIKAGLPALLAEHYFEHPRLQKDDARLTDEQQVELIRWEYQLRWDIGQRWHRVEYEAEFPQHADAVRQMKPQWRCPRCRKEFVLDETCQTLSCPDCGGESSMDAAPLSATESAPTQFDLREYELIEAVNEGGMGEVYRSGDPALGRDLAIKVMKSEYRGHAKAERRFLREARVTGSLQHPGIVPVYNLGRLSDARLHYTMRLVRGQTFAEILKEEAGKPERLPSLLSIFEKICQAMAYAHSKRVIHRDLKPQNVMVGKFGEVQVIDWGLAKVMKPGDVADEPDEATDIAGTHIYTESADTPVDLSRTGAGFGTLQYMPSEQARGKWKLVDERADVFALGSIICEILTGQPAYFGSNSNELWDRVERGDVTETLQRLQQCGADATLTALCRECLSPHREDRPRDASVVAKRVAEYQAEVQERLRQAELERTEAEVKSREEHKRRRLAVLLSSVMLLILTAGTAISLLFALDAHSQTLAAKKNAEDAAREKQKADENAKRAFEKEQIATHAQKETETVLVSGLLRPISGENTRGFGFFGGVRLADLASLSGQQLNPFGNLGYGSGFIGFSGGTWKPLNLIEVEALTSLRALPSDRVRVRFLEEGLRSAETARRLKDRAEWMIQALVGLDAGRRRQVEEVLVRHLRQANNSDEVRELCVILGTALEVQDPSFEELAASLIISVIARHIRQNDLNTLPEILQTLQKWGERLNAPRAGQVADALLSAMRQTTSSNALFYLAPALQAVGGRLDAMQAGKVADALLADLNQSTKPNALAYLPSALQAVSGRLDAVHAGKIADALLSTMSHPTDTNALQPLYHLSEALQTVSGCLNAEEAVTRAGKAADILLAIMSGPIDANARFLLVQSLRAVSVHLDAAHAGKVADVLLADLSREIKTTNSKALFNLSPALQAVSGRLDAAQAGKVADALLAALNRTSDPISRSYFLQALQVVSARMDAEAIAAREEKAIDVLLATLSRDIRTDDVSFSSLPVALKAVSRYLDASHAGKISDALLTDICQTTNPRDLNSLTQALQVVSVHLDAAHAGKVADVLLAEMKKTNAPPTAFPYLSQALQAVSERLDAAHAGKVADALLAAMNRDIKTANSNAHFYLSSALQAVSGRVDGAHAGKIADALLAALSRDITNAPYSWAPILQALSGRMEAREAATCANNVADILLAAMSRITDPDVLFALAPWLQVVGGYLDAVHAGKVADALLSAMSQTRKTAGRQLTFAHALQAVSGRLDAAHAGKIADALLPFLCEAPDSSTLVYLLQALQTVSEPRTTPDLLAMLSHPLAAGPAQRALLEVLGHRTRHKFRNTWHLLDWARSNGIDFASTK